jgi:cellulose synthase operon protein C
VKLSDLVLKWVGRVEVALVGAEGALREAEEALATGDAMRARKAAHLVLERAPKSLIGLALLADACELAGLHAELAMTLEELAPRLASRPDVWLRLGNARRLTLDEPDSVRDAYLRALALSQGASETRDTVLGLLADLDLAAGDGKRAEAFLLRLSAKNENSARIRQGEALLLLGNHPAALQVLKDVALEPTDGRGALAKGRALAAANAPEAFPLLLRAYVLDQAGASDALSLALGYVPSDAQVSAHVQAAVESKGERDLPRWKAAFARKSGDAAGARQALLDAARSGDPQAPAALLTTAIEEADLPTLGIALSYLETMNVHDPRAVDARVLERELKQDVTDGRSTRLDLPYLLKTQAFAKFEKTLVQEAILELLPESAPALWNEILSRLEAHARALQDLPTLSAIGSLALELDRPLRLAIVGEFNAGKSTFINALLGADIAPTGILPTTGTLHHLRYGKDRIAKIVLRADVAGSKLTEQLVPSEKLRETLLELDTSRVKRVEILEPLAWLTQVELLDTPGFNAPDPHHAIAAREALHEADAILWLLDASQAFKDTERAILEEVKQAGIPLQVFVNKRDRLSETDLASVMTLVENALDALSLKTLAKPIALSTRLALKGKLGDSDAWRASNFAAVDALFQQLFDGTVTIGATTLKDQALRRRARILVGQLGMRAMRRCEDGEARKRGMDAAAETRRAALVKLERDEISIGQSIESSLEPALKTWKKDLAMVAVGRDRNAFTEDAGLRSYASERAVSLLTPALERALSGLLPRPLPNEAQATLRAMVRVYAQSVDAGSDLTGARSAEPLARALIASAAEWLTAIASDDDRTDLVRSAELRLFADALALRPKAP